MAVADSVTPLRGTVIAPHLGALLVDYDPGLGLGPSHLPLHEVQVGKDVKATATIATLKAFKGRTRLILDDGHGGTANVLVDTSKVMAAFRAAGFPPGPGARVTVRGSVDQPPLPGAPRGITARSIRVVA
ncbi:hypothetical protein ACIRLA_22130 [Streptomyces sp. NPDC102364]|uniref:hypothetical protein n=1 Tax=Streptomyces sp. NPDC102364 TaxID=3366161 RepID=UPI0037F1A993